MEENKFRINTDKGDHKSVFTRLDGIFNSDGIFEKGLPVIYLPKILFVTGLLILYIANSHYSEKMIRKIDKLEVEVEDLRADFTTLKADYMYARLQSEVAEKVEPMGLVESSKPPYKIMIEEK